MTDDNILRPTDLSTGNLYVDPDMGEEIYGAVPVSELQDLAKEWREEAATMARTEADPVALNRNARELEELIGEHTDE